jgi:hypothetical protein
MAEDTLQAYSYIMAVLSGIGFWAAFFMFGFVARRYTAVFNRKTYYGLMMAAPSGILVYSIVLVLKTSLFVKDAKINEAIQDVAYVFLFLSAALCLFALLKFNRLLDELSGYKGKEPR